MSSYFIGEYPNINFTLKSWEILDFKRVQWPTETDFGDFRSEYLGAHETRWGMLLAY
jgi:hypothetical protein